jgi:tRNA_anti-like
MESSVDVLALPGSTRLARKGGHRRCARCGKVASSRALQCRRCGKKQRINPRVSLLVLSGVFLAGMFAFASAGPHLPRLPFGRSRAGSSAPAAGVAPLGSPGLAGESGDRLTAAELWGQYNLNAARADLRFKNKPVTVTGVVADVRRDYRGHILLRLATGDALETVRATVINRDDSGRSLPIRGQLVSLRCTGHGVLIGAPVLDACVVR